MMKVKAFVSLFVYIVPFFFAKNYLLGYARQFSTDYGTTAYIKADGSLWGMGKNTYGSIGEVNLGHYEKIPQQIVRSGVIEVSVGTDHLMFIKEDGTLWGLGMNYSGQLGTGDTNDTTTPVMIETDLSVTQVSAGLDSTFFILEDGSLWGMGSNGYGHFGDGTKSPAMEPTYKSPIKIIRGEVKKVDTAKATFFLKTNGSLWGMGNNDKGIFGDGTTDESLIPKMIISEGVVDFDLSASGHVLFKKEDNSLWGMGHNWWGQLTYNVSNPNNDDVLEPRKIIDQGVDKFSAGLGSSLFIKFDGSLWGIGNNQSGNLGVDDSTSSSTHSSPVLIESSGVHSVAAGDWTYDTLFTKHKIDSNGSIIQGEKELWGTGTNTYGELGNGTNSLNDVSNIVYTPILIDSVSASRIKTYEDGLSEGNTTGIDYVKTNPEKFNLYTETELNSSKSDSFEAGKDYVQNFLSEFGLYNELDMVENQESSIIRGRTEILDEIVTVVTKVASNYDLNVTEAIESYSYSDFIDSNGSIDLDEIELIVQQFIDYSDIELSPYTSGWFYSLRQGWSWTRKDVYPYIYRDKVGWQYFKRGYNLPRYYNYDSKSWFDVEE